MKHTSIVIMFCFTFFPDLSKLYKLLKNIPRGLQAMVAELEEHITRTGRNLFTVYYCTHRSKYNQKLKFKKIVTELGKANLWKNTM